MSGAKHHQSYNRYSYALNNPLKYTDPDGENPILIGMAVGAIMGAGQHAINGGGNLKSWVDAIVIGAWQGGFTAGVGSVFPGARQFLVRAGIHGTSNGLISAGSGQGFGLGFATGAFGSVFAHIGGEWAQSHIGQYVGGAAGGAFGAAITKQNVLDGAARGLLIALVNDGLHTTFKRMQRNPDPPTRKPKYNQKTLRKFIKKYRKYLGNMEKIEKIYANGLAPDGYDHKNGSFISKDGNRARGITVPSSKKGGSPPYNSDT